MELSSLGKEMEQVNALIKKLADFKRDDGVNGVGVVIKFLGHRVQPIKD